MITTRPKCSRKLYDFIGDLMQMIPNSTYYPRGTLTVTQLTDYANSKDFTHLVLLSEKEKQCNG
jgi:ribosome production factor 1